MKLSRFEQEMKKRLEERAIEPSKMSWHSLEKNLDLQDQRNTSKRFWYLGVAVSLIGVFLVSQFYFKSTDVDNPNPILKDDINTVTEHTETVIEKIHLEEETIVSNPQKGIISKSQEQKSQEKSVVSGISTIKPDTLKVNKTGNHGSEIANVIASAETATQTNEITWEYVEPELQNQEPVTDAYLERLLAEAEEDIQIKEAKELPQSEIVNAEDLLEGVEMDIEYSFREKVLDVILTGFGKVKTAVVERNK